jgi:hypothetical protein
MNMAKLLVVAAIVCASAVCSYAQEKTPVVDQRQQNQAERIDQGIKSGQLTRREAARLRAQQRKIRADKAKAKADGNVTARERAKLRREQNRASRAIHRKKHNKRKRA